METELDHCGLLIMSFPMVYVVSSEPFQNIWLWDYLWNPNKCALTTCWGICPPEILGGQHCLHIMAVEEGIHQSAYLFHCRIIMWTVTQDTRGKDESFIPTQCWSGCSHIEVHKRRAPLISGRDSALCIAWELWPHIQLSYQLSTRKRWSACTTIGKHAGPFTFSPPTDGRDPSPAPHVSTRGCQYQWHKYSCNVPGGCGAPLVDDQRQVPVFAAHMRVDHSKHLQTALRHRDRMLPLPSLCAWAIGEPRCCRQLPPPPPPPLMPHKIGRGPFPVRAVILLCRHHGVNKG